MKVFGLISSATLAKYILDPPRMSPSGPLSTKPPDRLTTALLEELLELGSVAADEGLRPDFLGKARQIHLGPGADEPVGIVEHENARSLEPAPKIDGGIEFVPTLGQGLGGIVAQED